MQKPAARQGRHGIGLFRYLVGYLVGKQLKEKVDVAVKIIDLKTIDNEVTKYLLSM